MNSAASHPVRLRGVTKRYGSTTAVSNLDLDVERAEVLALLGPALRQVRHVREIPMPLRDLIARAYRDEPTGNGIGMGKAGSA